MIYYTLPGTGIYGGIKAGFQMVECLRAAGAPACAVTPDGTAPRWFAASVPVMAEAEAWERLEPRDTVMFSLPDDYSRMRSLAPRLVFHCQGTDPRIDPILADHEVPVLTGWPQATAYARARGRDDTTELGIAISDAFLYAGEAKIEGTIAAMPRRGAALVEACRRRYPRASIAAIDGEPETAVARRLKSSEIFLATAAGEWFGLPALEAMAAGCVVLSVPVLGGMDYLESGANCVVAAPDAIPDHLGRLLDPASRPLRATLRAAARATAARYRLRSFARGVARWLAAGGGLAP